MALYLYFCHQGVNIIFNALQLSLLIFWVGNSTPKTYASTASAVLSFVAALVLCGLSFMEHARSLCPSSLLSGYILMSLMFDIVRTRTVWLMEVRSPVPELFIISDITKLAILVLESSWRQIWQAETSYVFGETQPRGVQRNLRSQFVPLVVSTCPSRLWEGSVRR